ncbi:NUDIX domain-containing protein [Streptomonospora litoralis]|uniref:Nudix hydrolase domain-containing protein n=1 Tax=Streptomonospora litoralis TaxID=2498135 RepID=A0A4P6PWC7_9ACTN|nr:NUDIX hydrolase [Streptomonospora litoralis]QBI51930.1 hypothetical protein EKD16_00545 [Streptomonospora litoralis]
MKAGDGDGWVTLPDGSRRWGRFGSAGLLLHADGREPPCAADGGRVLMQHRALWSHQGGTWGVPGGARDSDESPVQAALREFGEEVAGDTGEIELIGLHRQEHTVWRYDTVLARTAADAPLEAANWESDEVRWVDVGEVVGLRLLPAFGRTWPLLRDALGRRLALDVDAAAVAPDGGAAELERLRDELAGLAAAGVAAEALPEGLEAAGLHLWFPRVRLLVGTEAAAPEPVPGVEVARAGSGIAAGGDRLAEPGAGGGVRTQTVLVTGSDGAYGPGAQGMSAGGAQHTVPPEWLSAASSLPGAAADSVAGPSGA